MPTKSNKSAKSAIVSNNFTLLEKVDNHRVLELLYSDYDIPVEAYPYLISQISDQYSVVYSTTEGCPDGRRYAKDMPSYQNLVGDIKAFISQDNYIDIDIENCFPTILLELAKEAGLETGYLAEYVKNRENMIKSNPKIKKDVIVVIHGGESDSLEDNFKRQIRLIVDTLIIKHKVEGESVGAQIGKLLQKVEWTLISKVIDILKTHKIDISAYCFDGVVAPKSAKKYLDEINNAVSPYKCVIKPWKVFKVNQKNSRNTFNWTSNINWSDIIKINGGVFQSWGEFDKKMLPLVLECYRFIGQNILVKTGVNEYAYKPLLSGSVTVSSKRHKLTEVLDRYLGLISCDYITAKPVPKNNQFSLWRGFGYKSLDWSDSKVARRAELFIRHIRDNICNGNLTVFEHFMGLLAFYIQRPFERSDIAYIFSGLGGTGKSTVGRIMKRVLGEHNIYKISGLEQLTRGFNAHLEGKMLIWIEELKSAKDSDWVVSINHCKDLIDGDTINIERKGIDCYQVENTINVVGFSNHKYPLPMVEGITRRFHVEETNPAPVGGAKFFDELYREAECDEFINAIGTHLERLPLVNLRILPTSELKDKAEFRWVSELEKCLLILWIEGGKQSKYINTNNIKDVADRYRFRKITEHATGRLGDDIRSLLGSQHPTKRKYELKSSATFKITKERVTQTQQFMDDFMEEQEDCLLDDNNGGEIAE